ncbi:bactofilin family protein [Paraurantiacibacter namhicola]|uniref:bactofilin family protein n=1 Tax=Paraurantiacibacter namhicola TaxID=645517 RepID=UPI00083701CE|nr:polymer-forming cytoskeletal protein [Paraurantiacibacter namhicola]
MANPGSTFSVLGPDVSITGDISANADLHVDGKVHGDITCKAIVQGEESVINGSIEAESARISGTVKGTISARELVVLRSARIEGDVRYEALTVEQGAHIEGRFSHGEARASTQGAKPAAKQNGNDGGEPVLTVAN